MDACVYQQLRVHDVLHDTAADIAAAVARPEMRSELERRMLAPESATPQDLASTITRELAVWSALVDEYKLTAD